MEFLSGNQSFQALKGIDLEVASGDIELLMGPSGSGKTTLLSILGGILTPTAGQVYLLGEEITGLSRTKLARFRLENIGFIFQGFNLFPALTVAENVETTLNLKGIRGRTAKQHALKLLEQVGLADKARSLPHDLSGGQKQRVAIARALAGNPRIIFADEPTAALDSQKGRAIIELLRALAKEEGATVVMVTHDPRIMDVADRVVYVEDGMISPPFSFQFLLNLFLMAGERVFVTGGTGFVGANLVRLLLERGYRVRALVRPQSCLDNLQGLGVEVVTGELTDPNLAALLQGSQALFHVAAHYSLWRADRDRLYRSNVLGTRNMLAAARQAGVERTIYTSSVAAIGVPADGRIADETYQSPVEKLVGDYKKSKFLAEQEAHEAVRSGQDVVIVNPSTPIGPGIASRRRRGK